MVTITFTYGDSTNNSITFDETQTDVQFNYKINTYAENDNVNVPAYNFRFTLQNSAVTQNNLSTLLVDGSNNIKNITKVDISANGSLLRSMDVKFSRYIITDGLDGIAGLSEIIQCFS